jgi:ketosteroid isomerase-like protein
MATTPELSIRMRRAAFNQAIADRDLNAIAPILAPDAVLVAGTDSAVISGRKAQLLTWKREFAAPDRTIYVRTPATIEASSVQPLGFEHGHWQGMSVDNVVRASGAYTAKWRQIGSDWVIEGELYLTLT